MKKWIIVLLFFMAGCATWQQTDGPFKGAGYTLDLPKGWMATKNPKSLHITKDGPSLQEIYVYLGDISTLETEPKKKLKKGMLPQELAETVLDRMRSNKKLVQFAVVENEPAQLGGVEGFRLVYTYKSNKVRYRGIYYGMLQGDTYYRISYDAPVRYYFDKDVRVFEEIIKSFKLVAAK